MPSNSDSCILINNLSIQLESDQLNKLINVQVINVFARRGPIVISVLNDQEILITPMPDVQLTIDDNFLKGSLPAHISTNLKVPVKKIKVETDLKVHFEAYISLVDGNELSVNTRITDIEWIGDLDIQPPLLDFIIPDNMVQDMVEKQLPAINEKINETLKEVLDVNTLLSRTVWNKVVRIPLKNDEEMYLSVRPEYIEIYKVNFENNQIKLSINTRVLVKPSDSSERPDIAYQPRIIFLESVSSNDTLYVEVRLDLRSLDAPALKVVKSVRSIEKAIGCTIEKILVRPVNGDGVAIALKLKGALNGGLSIAGKPLVSQNDLMLDIENLSFDFSGKNILSSLKGNIALSVAKSVIRKQFPIALGPYIENLIMTVNDMISSLRLANGLFLKGNIKDWRLSKMDIAGGQAVVIFQTDVVMHLAPEK